MTAMSASVVRVNDFGLCEVAVDDQNDRRRAGFTLDKLVGYRGEPVREFGIREGVKVVIEEFDGRVESAKLANAAANS